MPTYQNAEILNQIYYSDCLQVQIEAVEASLNEGLGLEKAGYEVELDLDALLRMDSATQVKTLNEAIGGGWMKIDEGRQKRNLPPVPGGDTPYMQQQNYALAALMKRDQSADPFATAKPEPAAPAEPAANDERAMRDLAAKFVLRVASTDRVAA
jgi:phage portal protein BeeE